MKHTPGPWELVEWENDAGAQRVFFKNIYIGNVYNSDMSREQILSNARLIASSPELFEACVAVFSATATVDNPDFIAALAMVEMAIKKAEGRK